MSVSMPNGAVKDGDDLLAPLNDLLAGLNLLPSEQDLADAAKPSAALRGTPASVAVIEGGATSAAKWWSAGAGAAIVGMWGSVAGWWSDLDAEVQGSALIGAAVVTAALALAIGFLLGNDVRGRATAAAATIEARRAITVQWVKSSAAVYDPSSLSPATLIALPSTLAIKLTTQPSSNESGWRAVAIERAADGTLRYIVVKGSQELRATAAELDFQ
jgi:hypothetical protein